MSNKWIVVYCKSREESRAQKNLQLQGIDSFFPIIHREKILRGKKSVLEEALFPGYIFAFIDQKSTNFNSIRSTRGVYDLVRFGKEIAIISAQEIAQLKKACHAINELQLTPSSFLKSGDHVEILEGPFKGNIAIFSESDGLKRSILLVNMLNQKNKVSFNNKNINKLDN